ncbi:LLGL scribble cell polarity complex component 2 isoform X1 [Anolis carolinensis]|uniref:LLGL scribble cell polarity complex component 2 n=1 Tax=Anolis carolinensis TaxID=28377 RepID=G1KFR8_ANOCA|nr:PREDICTED: lethal(2) giant larvae protein homolog 2 isoform X1 [Anolis carolinensis]XP_016846833.1 PREDICTED: lethal(2) giant larvae protein homolog 2 isoform X1 [Anolis carolinensis]|eukprot:XP_003217256.1 PREDICTED: lethal(2) giant larvae protein homolog 2 isoform X1 [Anolis carolinensis]
MRRFLRSGHDPIRERLKRDLFQFNKTVEHGFPHQPSALGYSSFLHLMAIGTRSGAIKLYGAPGVEFMGLHEETNTVMQIHFIPGQCRLVTLLDDNSLHLWTLKQSNSNLSELQEERHFTLRGPPGSPPSATQVTAILAHSSQELLYLGTESGNVFVVEIPSFRVLEDQTICPEVVLQCVPEDYRNRRSLELVEALREHPRNPNQILIGYSRGLIVLWDLINNKATHHFLASQQLENLFWQRNGHQIISCHSDGSYTQWPVSSDDRRPEPLESKVPYGPFPCKAISKIYWQTTKNGLPYIIFQGGMPRASYGDRHSISVVHGNRQTAFDFTSRVIDFFVIANADPFAEFDEPSAMVVLAEEELVVIDLMSPGWPSIQPPYLASLHCSAITCSHHVSNIPLKLWERIISAGNKQNQFSNMPWPIDGGTSKAPDPPQRDLLLTGHEDGTVRFWNASGVCLNLLYKLSTVKVFLTDADPNDNMNQLGEDEWPPLRKVGSFDPYSDDPRLGIQKIFLCKYSGYLAVAGTAGQVLVLELNDEEADQVIDRTEADLLQDQEGYKWKGHERLKTRDGPVRFEPGFQPFVLVQCQPPAVVTSLALHSEWKLVAFGTSHGFGLFDHQQKQLVFVKCTLHPSDQLALEGPLSRVKSLKKSLRQSFRRMRRSRVSTRKLRTAEVQEGISKHDHDALQEIELAPVQRKIEARSAEDSFTGFVRTLYFADTFLRDSSRHTPSLWAGTNGGTVYAFCLRVPPAERRMDEPVRAEQAKEIQLMHRAPVVGIVVLDGQSTPLPEPLEVAHDLSKSPNMQGSHQLLVVSEEQLKVFTLPKVSSKLKLKLTALEGCRVRKVSVANFASCKTEYSENALTVLTNLGDIQIISLPSLKIQVRYPCIRKEDVSGIASCVFTRYGQGFYLISPSEFERFSLSPKWLVEPRCLISVPESTGNSHVHSPSAVENASRKSNKESGWSSGDPHGEEKPPGRLMEHALLNDENVLKEIQSTLESGRGSYSDRNSRKIQVGHRLSNGGAE